MSLRARIFIIISVIVLFILAVSIFLFVRSKKNNTTSTNELPGTGASQQGDQAAVSGTVIPSGVPVKTLTAEEMEKNSVEQLAKIFVERYGTYSTDNEFQNITESQSLVTGQLWTKISAAMKVKNKPTVFFGVTTKVVSTVLSDWSSDKAVVVLKTIRTENKEGVVKNNYQNATVGMVKVGANWLADTITWN
jgi:hypothetical protein